MGDDLYRGKLTSEKEFFRPNQVGVYTLSSARFYMHWLAYKLGWFDSDAHQLNEKFFYTDTDSYYLTYNTVSKMKNLGYIGSELGQFKIDTGDGKKYFILCGLYNVRKHYSLIYFDGNDVQFKIKQKGLSCPLKMNSAINVFSQNSKFILNQRLGLSERSEGLMTRTTQRHTGIGVHFKCILKRQRVGNPRTSIHPEDCFLRIPFGEYPLQHDEDQEENQDDRLEE